MFSVYERIYFLVIYCVGYNYHIHAVKISNARHNHGSIIWFNHIIFNLLQCYHVESYFHIKHNVEYAGSNNTDLL